MKKIINYIFPVVALGLAMTGCEKTEYNVYNVKDGTGIKLLQAMNLESVDINYNTIEVVKRKSGEPDSAFSFPLNAVFSKSGVAPADVKVDFTIDYSDLDSLNFFRNLQRLSFYERVPDSLLSFTATASTIAKGTYQSNDVFMVLSSKKIELGHNYIIPIRLTTTDSRYPVNDSYSLVYFIIDARYPPFPNLSLEKTVSQSTTGYGGDASRAVDGNTSGSWGNNSVTHTEEGLNTQAWWQVDIGSVNNIYQVDIYNRTDCCGDRLTNYHIFVSEEPFTGTTVAETQAQAGVKDFFQKATAGTPSSLGINTHGRYVRIQLDATNTPLSLAEVQVRGEP